MHYGFYTAASGLLTQQRTLNVLSNNLANIQTPGFKTERVLTNTFDYEYMTRFENGYRTHIGVNSPMLRVQEVITDFENNAVQETGYPYDMGIVGEGFFNIKGAERTYLTRNGNFDIDQDGYLILPNIGRVQGENGDIYVGGDEYFMNDEGVIFDNSGNYSDTILLTQPTDFANMKKFSNGMYVDETAQRVANPTVYQAMLERSNIDMNQEYTRVMETQNALQSCATALKLLDSMNAKGATLCSIQ